MKTGLIFSLICLLALPLAFAQQVTMPLIAGAQLEETTGTTTVTLDPAKYPIFTDLVTTQGNHDACEAVLNGLSGQYRPGQPVGYDHNNVLIEYSMEIPAQRRTTAEVMVTWVARIIGYQPAAVNPQLVGCGGSWYGTSWQSFDEGDVHTALYIRDGVSWKKVSVDKGMTVPAAGVSSITLTPPPPRDPTQVASYTVDADDFTAGEFPATLEARILWKNDSSMTIESAANFRTLILALLSD